MQKDKLINELETEVNAQLNTVKAKFIRAGIETLNRPATNGGWSILQCLDHLNSYGLYYLPQIENAIASTAEDSSKTYNTGWLGDYFVNMMAPETGKKKYKAFKGHIPQVDLDAETVFKEFLRQERLLITCLNKARKADLTVRIPISITRLITLKLGDTFRFIIAHNRRHIMQGERNLGDSW